MELIRVIMYVCLYLHVSFLIFPLLFHLFVLSYYTFVFVLSHFLLFFLDTYFIGRERDGFNSVGLGAGENIGAVDRGENYQNMLFKTFHFQLKVKYWYITENSQKRKQNS